jgi:hypothetical protein
LKTSLRARGRPDDDTIAGRFLHGVATLSNADSTDWLELVLACDAQLEASRWRSTLNNDGFPLQACVTASDSTGGVRLLADPASAEVDPVRRLRRGFDALTRLSRAVRDPAAPDAFARAVEDSLPPLAVLPALPAGALWIGCDRGGRGIAAYVTMRWGATSERWARALAWTTRWVGRAAAASLAALPEATDLVSVGVEGRSGAPPRAKLYFRLQTRCPLTTLGIPFFCEPWMVHFLGVALDDFALRRSGLVLSVSGDFWSDRVNGGKIDICAHCTPRTPTEWATCLGGLARDLGLEHTLLDPTRLCSCLVPAFVGLGIGSNSARRLNVYLKPPQRPVSA